MTDIKTMTDEQMNVAVAKMMGLNEDFSVLPCMRINHKNEVTIWNEGDHMGKAYAPCTDLVQAMEVLRKHNEGVEVATRFIEMVHVPATHEFGLRIGGGLKKWSSVGYFFPFADLPRAIVTTILEVNEK